MYKKVLFYLLVCVIGFGIFGTLSAQQPGANRVTLQGYVCDSITGERLEFITLQEKGTTNGTITNTDGGYSLLLRGNGTLVASCVGYQTKEIKANNLSRKVIIRLVPSDYTLSEVVVKPKREHYRRRGNPSVELARSVIDHKHDYALTDHDYYRCERYENTTYSFNNFDGALYRGWKKKFPDIDQYIDTAYSGSAILPVSSDESIESVYFQKNPKRVRTVRLGQRHVGLDDMMPGDLVAKAQTECFPEVNLDDNDIYMFTNKFVNPLSNFAIAFYKFYILDTLTFEDGNRYIDLGFAPLMPEQFGFIGHLYVSTDSTFFLKKADLSIPPDINLNFVRNMHMIIEQERLADSTVVITRKKFESEMTIVGETTGLYAQREMCYSKFMFDEPDTEVRQLLDGFSPHKEAPDMMLKKDDFWAEHRIGDNQSRNSQVNTMLNAMRERPFFKYSELVLTWLFKGYIPLTKKPFEENEFLYGPLNTSASYNSMEGLRLRTGGLTTAALSRHWFGFGYLAYGCKDHKFKYDTKLEYSFKDCKIHSNEFPMHKIVFDYNYDTNLLGQDPTTSKDNFLLSLKRDDSEKISYERRADLCYIREFFGGFSWKLQGTWLREYSTDFAPFVRSDGQFNQMPWGGVRSYDLAYGTLQLRYAPHETFIQSRLSRTPINHEHPVFVLQHSYGQKGFLGSDFDYQRTDFTFEKRFWMSAFGYIDAQLKAGKVWSQSPYAMLCLPNVNLGFTIQEHAFSQMNAMEFVADRYCQWDLVYYMNGWIFNTMPIMKKLKWREIVSFRGYYGELSGRNDPFAKLEDGSLRNPELYCFPVDSGQIYTKMPYPYMEATIGVENVFKLLRIEYIRRLNYLEHDNISPNGVQVAVHITF